MCPVCHSNSFSNKKHTVHSVSCDCGFVSVDIHQNKIWRCTIRNGDKSWITYYEDDYHCEISVIEYVKIHTFPGKVEFYLEPEEIENKVHEYIKEAIFLKVIND